MLAFEICSQNNSTSYQVKLVSKMMADWSQCDQKFSLHCSNHKKYNIDIHYLCWIWYRIKLTLSNNHTHIKCRLMPISGNIMCGTFLQHLP